jgi:CMP-N,N'-diacetyllegionaminic acid synthase
LRLLALIPARGGSKRVPGKNLRPLGGLPLVTWSIKSATELPEIQDVLVSTDDVGIADVARAVGASVPWLRPPELATDFSSAIDVCIHALDWYEAERGPIGGLILLQPTSPFRTPESVRRGIGLFEASGRRPVIGVSPARSHPMWCYRVEGFEMRPFIEGADPCARSQDLPPAFVVNGAFYLMAPEDLRRERSFETPRTVPLVMTSPGEDVDIDTEQDWARAEAMVLQADFALMRVHDLPPTPRRGGP